MRMQSEAPAPSPRRPPSSAPAVAAERNAFAGGGRPPSAAPSARLAPVTAVRPNEESQRGLRRSSPVDGKMRHRTISPRWSDGPSVPLSQRRRPFPLFYYSVFFRDEGEDRVAGPFGIASATVERVKSDQVVLLCENGGELKESVCGRRRGRQTRITMSLARLLPFLLLVKSNVATSSVKIYMEKGRGKSRSQSLYSTR